HNRASAFQAPLWMDMIHRRLCKPLRATQHTVTIRDKAGTLQGVFALVRQKVMGLAILQPADFGVCDYNGPVGSYEVFMALSADRGAQAKLAAQLGPCDLFLFNKVREKAFDIGRLLPRLKAVRAENASYLTDVGMDFEQWRRKTLRRKFSKELARVQRVVEREYGSYEHRPAANSAEIRAAFDLLRVVRLGRFRRDLLDSPLYYEFYRDYAIAA